MKTINFQERVKGMANTTAKPIEITTEEMLANCRRMDLLINNCDLSLIDREENIVKGE